MNLLQLVTACAATWYIAYAVTKTHGPFGVFVWLRDHMPLGGLTTCIVCLTLWVALIISWIMIGYVDIIQCAAIAGGALWLHGYTGWRIDI